MATHTDPVCGMKGLEEKNAAGMSEHDGVTYYFDTEECITKFNQQPERYAVKAGKEGPNTAGRDGTERT